MMMPFASKLASSATQMIRMDHSHVMEQFHKIQPDASDTVCAAAARSICAELEIHAQLEEELFYPALPEAGVMTPKLDKSLNEHGEMRRLIERVRSFDGQRAAQVEAVRDLMKTVMHHVAEEETELLPAAEQWLGKERLAELGARMAERRMELMKPRAAELASDWARAAPGKTALMTVGALVAGTLLVSRMRHRQHHHHHARY